MSCMTVKSCEKDHQLDGLIEKRRNSFANASFISNHRADQPLDKRPFGNQLIKSIQV